MYRVLVFRCHSCMCSFAWSKSDWSSTEFDWTIVRLSVVWLFSISKMFGWVRSCSIAESNLQSKWELFDHQTFDDSTGCLLPNIIHTVHIPSLSPDGIVNMDIFNLDYEQSLIFLSPSNKTRENTHARDWRRETGYEQSLLFLSPSNKTRENTHTRDWRRETGRARKKSLFFLLRLPPSFLASRGFAARRCLTRVANWREEKRLLAVYL